MGTGFRTRSCSGNKLPPASAGGRQCRSLTSSHPRLRRRPRPRHGPPDSSMQIEVLPTWPIRDDEVLVFVMAGGVNYNGIWAGLGQPISPHDVHKNPFHVAGSDAAGIVWAIGS